MIASIDIPVDSVVLETQFVELTEQGLKALGIDFNNANGQIGVVTLGSGSFTVGLPEQGCNGVGDQLLRSRQQRRLPGGALCADPEGQWPHRLEAANLRAERLDRQDRHR